MNQTFQYEIPLSCDLVYDQLLDFRKFGDLHPYIREVIIISSQAEGTEYEAREKIKLLGFIPMSPVYRATVSEIKKQSHLRYISQVKKNVSLTIDFHLSEEHGKTNVQEIVDVRANALIASVFLKTVKKAHAAVFEKMGMPGIK